MQWQLELPTKTLPPGELMASKDTPALPFALPVLGVSLFLQCFSGPAFPGRIGGKSASPVTRGLDQLAITELELGNMASFCVTKGCLEADNELE